MPIRNSKVASSEMFKAHRKARLTNLRGPSEPEIAREEENVQEAETPPETKATRTSAFEDQPDVLPEERPEVKQDEHEAALLPKPEKNKTPAPDGSRKKQQSKNQAGHAARFRLNMNLAYPAAGTCPTFDHIAGVEDEQLAFRLVLGKALEAYAAAATAGAVDDAPRTYPESQTVTKTSRMFPKDAYDELSKILNPTGLISVRLMGTIIGRRALAAFVAEDSKSD